MAHDRNSRRKNEIMERVSFAACSAARMSATGQRCSAAWPLQRTWVGSPQAIVPSPTADTISSEAPRWTKSSVLGVCRVVGAASLLDDALLCADRGWAVCLLLEQEIRILAPPSQQLVYKIQVCNNRMSGLVQFGCKRQSTYANALRSLVHHIAEPRTTSMTQSRVCRKCGVPHVLNGGSFQAGHWMARWCSGTLHEIFRRTHHHEAKTAAVHKRRNQADQNSTKRVYRDVISSSGGGRQCALAELRFWHDALSADV